MQWLTSSQLSTLRSSIRFKRHVAAPPKPHLGEGAGGAGSLSASAPGIGDSTAPFAPEGQSFLDNLIAGYGSFRASDVHWRMSALLGSGHRNSGARCRLMTIVDSRGARIIEIQSRADEGP